MPSATTDAFSNSASYGLNLAFLIHLLLIDLLLRCPRIGHWYPFDYGIGLVWSIHDIDHGEINLFTALVQVYVQEYLCCVILLFIRFDSIAFYANLAGRCARKVSHSIYLYVAWPCLSRSR